jgi:hypothetical protein
VRETALGALLDLDDGNVERAVRALRNVLALQYPDSSWPWRGTFPVAAETPAPPGADAVEWVHYDPNWRQFIGCTLALCRIVHADRLPADVLAGIGQAIVRCVVGEPDDRIAPWYTNPNLMHAWLQAHVGTTTGDDGLVHAAHARLQMLVHRVERHGDIDEYNSPTYDGVDLWAIGLWATLPPTPEFAAAAATVLERVGARISTLYHPGFGMTCGPHIRAYGLDPTAYVSLSGVLFWLCGQPPDRVLPSPIDADTVHVHDLYFLPAFRHVADALTPHLHLEPVVGERHHEQRFTGSVARSLLRDDLAVGWEHGRRHEASLDQYVPFSALAIVEGRPTAVGVMVPEATAWIDVRRTGELTFELEAAGRADAVALRIVTTPIAAGASTGPSSGPPGQLTIGRWRLDPGRPPAHVDERSTAIGREIGLRWTGDRITAEMTL